MLREELQDYLTKLHSESRVDTEHTIGGRVQIRFELGGIKENGTSERVNQAVERATTLFNETFDNEDDEIWILIYEYESGGDGMFTAPNDYLLKHFPQYRISKFYNQIEKVVSRYFTEDEKGNSIPEIWDAKIIIGKIPVSEINAEGILRGIANLEMGLEPAIGQRVFFLNPKTDRGFQMYDDRGCYVWSSEADSIRKIYNKRNEWIVDHERSEIEKYFK